MYESLNDFIEEGAQLMVTRGTGNGMNLDECRDRLTSWVDRLLKNKGLSCISSACWQLTRIDNDPTGRVEWSLDQNGLTYYDYDDDGDNNIFRWNVSTS